MKGIGKVGIGLGVALMSLWILPGPAGAARPLNTDDAGTVAVNKFELDLGYGDESVGEINRGFSLLLRHGITERLDLYVGTECQLKPESGLDEVNIGFKGVLIPVKGNFPGFSLSVNLEPGQSEYFINAILSQPWGEKLLLHFNLGYTNPEAFKKGDIFWGGAFDWAVVKRFNLVGEFFGEEGLGSENTSTRSWLVGGKSSITDYLVLDIATGTKLSEDPGWYVTGGMTLTF